MSQPRSADGLARRSLVLGGGAALLAGGAFAAAGATSPVVVTRGGELRGYLDGGVSVFKGIPYGADTTARRFQRPLPAPAWRGVRDATAYGPSAPQARPDGPVSEDCLVLNVWTPGLRTPHGGR